MSTLAMAIPGHRNGLFGLPARAGRQKIRAVKQTPAPGSDADLEEVDELDAAEREDDDGAAIDDATPLPADAPVPTDAFVRGQEFLRRCIAGEPGMRDEFVAQYRALVRYAVAAVLRMKEPELLATELDDLTQSALLSLFDRDCRRLKMYEGRNHASFATFVRVCSSRHALDFLRGLRRRPRAAAEPGNEDDAEDRLSQLVDPSAGPEEQALASQRIDLLRTAVAGLSAREQILVRLAFVEGRETSEVATVLGVSDNAIHVLKSRVRAKLRDRLSLECFDDE